MEKPTGKYTDEALHDLGQTIIHSPKERYVLTVGQYLGLRMHVNGCGECSAGMDRVLLEYGAEFKSAEWGFNREVN